VSSAWVLGLALAINAVSVVLIVLAVRERRRIGRSRSRFGLDAPLSASRVDEATRRLRS
jgi:hypothetical protein